MTKLSLSYNFNVDMTQSFLGIIHLWSRHHWWSRFQWLQGKWAGAGIEDGLRPGIILKIRFRCRSHLTPRVIIVKWISRKALPEFCKVLQGGWEGRLLLSTSTLSFQNKEWTTQFGHSMTTGNGKIGWMGRTVQCRRFPFSCWQSMAELGVDSGAIYG